MKLHGKGLRIFCINTNTTSGQIIPKNTDIHMSWTGASAKWWASHGH